jgi:F-type H+-transporting ATPase subunit b
MLESLNYYKFILVALNLIILYIVLRKVLFKPVTEFMENRANSIRENIESAKRQVAEASELKADFENQLSSAKAEAYKIIEDGRQNAEKQSQEILISARNEAEKIIQKAREQIEFERQQMLKEMRSQIASLSLAAASKVVEANMNTEANRKLIDNFIDEEGVA